VFEDTLADLEVRFREIVRWYRWCLPLCLYLRLLFMVVGCIWLSKKREITGKAEGGKSVHILGFIQGGVVVKTTRVIKVVGWAM